jgi:CRISPR/Cas system CMR subunit Cmr4 (Cas7 group RAMP superfamily)
MAFPVRPGKERALRRFVKELTDRRQREFADFEKRTRTTKELWYLQKSPQGSLVVVYFESRTKPEKAIEVLRRSRKAFDRWFKQQIKNISGLDFDHPPPDPLPEQILQYGR